MKSSTSRLPLVLTVTALLLGSCANYRPYLVPDEKESLPAGDIAHTVYLIGDTGSPVAGSPGPGMALLGRHLAAASENSTVVMLGNTLYEQGMPPEENIAERQEAEKTLTVQLDLLAGFPGGIFFVAGNRDWSTFGVEGLKRQRDFIERYLGRDDIWEPDCGCGDPKEIDLTDDLVLILLDTQWWLSDWDGEPEVNKNCEGKSRDFFRLLFDDAVKGNREKNMILAMHHPVFSKGPHGGAFTARQHLFPLTDVAANLWLPLPGIGSLYPFYRASVGGVQDLANAEYKALREFILGTARKNGSFVIAGAHDYSLQYIEKENQHFIVSGGGAFRTPTRGGGETQFAYGNYGFSQIDYYADGSARLRFWAPDETTGAPLGRVVFEKLIKEPLPELTSKPELTYNTRILEQDSIQTRMVKDTPGRKGFGRWLWGRHYRDAYEAELSFPVLRLDTFRHGMIPLKMGGGYQTNSLRLENPEGRQYTMRSIDKDPSRTVPYPLNRSDFVLDIVRDGFNASHPMSALPVPGFADAVGVYHTNPDVYYVPKQPRLDRYNEDFGDGLYLVEERPDNDLWQAQHSFGRPDDIVSTADVIEERIDDPKNRVDYRAVVRARIFDLLIGDWDRHDDQWRWSVFDRDSVLLYQPIPRDRDQAFSRYDGFLYNLISHTAPAARPLRPYRSKQNKIQWSNYGCRHFDATFLTGASWDLWSEELVKIQNSLPDAYIDQVFRAAWPDRVYDLDGQDVAAIMKARRDNLEVIARDFYEFRAKKVDVVGTDEPDRFEVVRMNDRETRVTVYSRPKKQNEETMIFQRTFLTGETRQIMLYGLREDDVFQIRGEVGKGPLIRIIGGLGNDRIDDQSRVGGWSRKNLVYDAKEEAIELHTGPDTGVRLKADPKFNTYNRRSKDYEFNFGRLYPNFGFNPDDGFLIGVAPVFTTYGFKKSPYATLHKLSFKYAFSTSGYEITYQGDFTEALGREDLRIAAVLRSPLYAYNFYGLGNETESPEEGKEDNFNRVRQRYYGIAPSFLRRLRGGAEYSLGPTFESHRIDTTGGRYIDEIAPGLNQEMFEGLEYLGFHFNFTLENFDSPSFPTHGLSLQATAGWKWSMDNKKDHFPYLLGSAGLYQQLESSGRLVIATRVGGQHIFNNRFEFFQGATLGGLGPNSNLRGFRRERFTGRSSFYHNTDLRWKAIESGNNVLPFTVGLFTGFDYGRVWVDGEDSRVWHYAYGLGLWLSPLDLIDLNFSWFRGDGIENRFNFGGKFFF